MREAQRVIAFIEDEPKLLDLILFNLRDRYPVKGYRNAEDFFADFNRDRTALVVTDVRLPGMSGIGVLEALRETAPEIPVVIMTAYGSISQAVSAVKHGAYDYLTKPVSIKDLSVVIDRALQFDKSLDREAPPFPEDSPFYSADPRTLSQCSLAAKVASSKVPVLILGETGTGKELVAEMIHAASGRSGNFVRINCAAIPAELLEGELFGYRKGAFTGALQSYEGKLRLADGGSIFLDEIGEMSEGLQAKLLRVIETEQFYPVGDNTLVKVDIRVITATNKDLRAEAEQGRFRLDLYYRLAVVPVRIPPLRERQADIEPLARRFFRETLRERLPEIDPAVFGVFRNYRWPGNVRELRNIVTHMGLLASGKRITVEDIPPEIRENQSPETVLPLTYGEFKELKKKLKEDAVRDMEREFIRNALDANGWNVSRTAAAVDMDRRYLQNLMKRYGISRR